ncbi:DUF3090 family protein [Allonocardiopsis opalescens]|uniref:Putative repeat protein (TIGR03847 family) n=1 Tax=Allonocardiopsis opalescens TaxID=1144618 RepID=A0A2T0Q4D1_9ACTN|nr:DUF3090 family protein [Allonocardiopsis opalescens]PRX98629.1 putative repeat protein (TIGR03847 family) [Allonocardiopsis opalescens]
MPVYFYDQPERFVAGTVGQPGDRAFFLQARSEGRTTSVGLEKMQVSALAERIEELLDELAKRSITGDDVPSATPEELRDDEPLDQPLLEDFRVGTLALAWDPETSRVLIEAQAAGEADDEPAEPLSDDLDSERDVLRVRITPAAARAFAERALRVVAAGRPNCPLCGLPLDPDGHVCPRANGYRPLTPEA